MPLLSVRCNHCGAPLEVSDSTRFVTCQFCNSQLEVKQTGSSSYTEVIEKIKANTDQMANNLRVIELQNDLEQLDREWANHRETFYVSNKHGHRNPPTFAGGIVGIIVAVVAGIMFLSMSSGPGPAIGGGNGSSGMFGLFLIVFIGFAIFAGVSQINKSNGMQDAETHYRNRRANLLRSIDDARRNR